MKQHNLTQGSPEWLAYRATHFNASDAPAMLGVSPYKTRTQLLHELHTGLAPEVDATTQRRFDAGHAAEAAARPLAEEIIGEDLYPVVGSEGKLSASFDGLTMSEAIVWEHKLMNVALADSLANGIIPDSYHPQLEQQLMVSGAEKALFMATSPDRTAMECVWYASRPELRQQILQGWTQFAIDLAAYSPPAVVIEAVGRTPESLPALRIEVTGMVTASNLAQYKEHALAVFAGINRELTTDQHFADADKIVKWCGDVEERLAAAKQHALSQTESIDALFRTIDDISAEARRTRLELDKLVKARKEQVRGEIVAEGVAAIGQHIAALNQRLGKPYMPAVPADFAGAIKGKRSIESIRDAVNTLLANTTIQASAVADKIQTNLNTLREIASGHAFLFADTPTIVLKAPDDLEILVKSRIAEHRAAEEKKEAELRESIRAEEEAKATEAIAAAQVSTAVIAQVQSSSMEGLEPIAAEIAELVTHEAVVEIMMPDSVVQAMKPAEAPATPPTLRLGQMADRLGFTITAALLSEMKFEPSATDKAAKLYHEAEWPLICAALVERINRACVLEAA